MLCGSFETPAPPGNFSKGFKAANKKGKNRKIRKTDKKY